MKRRGETIFEKERRTNFGKEKKKCEGGRGETNVKEGEEKQM